MVDVNKLLNSVLGRQAVGRLDKEELGARDSILFDRDPIGSAQAQRQLADAIQFTPDSTLLQELGQFVGNAAAVGASMPTDILGGIGSILTEGVSATGLVSESYLDRAREASKAIIDSPRGYVDPLRELGQSDSTRLGNAIAAARTEIATQRNQLQRDYEVDRGDSPTLANLKQIGSDVIDIASITAQNTPNLPGIAGAVAGSLGGLSTSIKGLEPLTAAALRPAEQALNRSRISKAIGDVGPSQALRPLKETERRLAAGEATQLGRDITAAGTIGLTTGAGSQDTSYKGVMAIPSDELVKVPQFQEIMDEYNGDVTRAKRALAIRTASEVSNLTSLITGAAAQRLGVSALARNPIEVFKGMSIMDAAKLALGASVTQDQIQAMFPLIDLNRRLKDYDPDIKTFDNVGKAGGEALIASLMSASTAIPGVAQATGRAISRTTKKGIDKVLDFGEQRASEIKAEIEAESPVSDESVRSQAQEGVEALRSRTQATIEEDVPSVREDEPSNLNTLERAYDKIASLVSLDETDTQSLTDLGITANNRVEAISELANTFSTTEDTDVKRSVLSQLHKHMQEVNTSPEDMNTLQTMAETDKEFGDTFAPIYNSLSRVFQTPTVQRALQSLNESIQDGSINEVLKPVTKETSPKDVQDTTAGVLQVATNDLDKVNPEVVKSILEHAETNNLSQKDIDNLQLVQDYLTALSESEIDTSRAGQVSETIRTGRIKNKEEFTSAFEHTKKIISDLISGKEDSAKASLTTRNRKFVQSMNNKIEALNKSYDKFLKTGETASVPYNTFNPRTGAMFSSTQNKRAAFKGMIVDPDNPNSLDFVKTIFKDQQILSRTYNQLAKVMGVDPIKIVTLSSELSQKAGIKISASNGTKTTTKSKEAPKRVPEQPKKVALSKPAQQLVKTANALRKTISTTGRDDATKDKARDLLRKIREVTESDNPTEEALAPLVNQLNNLERGTRASELPNTSVIKKEINSLYRSLDKPTQIKVSPLMNVANAILGNKTPSLSPLAQDLKALIQDKLNKGNQVGALRDVYKAMRDTPKEETKRVTEEEGISEPTEIEAVTEPVQALVREKVDTRMKELFVTPKTPKTRLEKGVSPVTQLLTVMGSVESAKEFLGDTTGRVINEDILDAFKYFLTKDKHDVLPTVPSLVAASNKALSKFMKTKAKSLKEGSKLTDWANGRSLEFAAEVDGVMQYDQEVLELAAMATVDWWLTDGRRDGSARDRERIENWVESGTSSAAINKLLYGHVQDTAVQAVARNIQTFLGVSYNKKVPYGINEGAMLALAAQMLDTLVEQGKLTKESIELRTDPATDNTITQNVLTVPSLDVALPSDPHPDLLKDLIVKERDDLTEVIGSNKKLKVDTVQKNTVGGKLTNEQQEAIRKRQSVGFKVNLPMRDLFTRIGEEGIDLLFGTQGRNLDNLNVETRDELKGRALGFIKAWQKFQELNTSIEAYIEGTDITLDQVPVYYKHSVISSGRYMMDGAYTPQSHQLMRQLMMAYESTLDLSNEKHSDAFYLAIAQALGFDKKTVWENIRDGKDLIDGELKPLVDAFRKGEPTAEFIKSELDKAGVEVSPRTVMTVSEYARSKEAKGEFTTSLYYEMDGKTNGVFNLINLFGTGPYTEVELINLERGGMHFGEEQSLQDLNRPDLYMRTKEILDVRLPSRIKAMLSATKERKNLNNHIQSVYSALSGMIKGFSRTFDDKGNTALEFGRDLLKNPLTVIAYGSSAYGVANTLTKQFVGSIGELLSTASERIISNPGLSIAEAMFPDSSTPDKDFTKFQSDLNQLTNSAIVYTKTYSVIDTAGSKPIRLTKENIKEFTFNKQQLFNIQSNILNTLATPINSAALEVIGINTSDTLTNIVKLSNVQSAFLYHQFIDKLATAVDAQQKSDGTAYRLNNGIPRETIDTVIEEMSPMFTQLGVNGAGLQAFKTQALQWSEVSNSKSGKLIVGASLNDNIKAEASVRGPQMLGVSVIPQTTIGLGDGYMQMVRTTVENTLDTFDGVSVPLTEIDTQGLEVNKAAREAINNNGIRGLVESFKTIPEKELNRFYDALENGKLPTKILDDLSLSFDGRIPNRNDVNSAIRSLDERADRRDARIKVQNEYKISFDQMAGPETPYVSGEKVLPSLEETVESLNKDLKEALTNISKDVSKPTEVTVAGFEEAISKLGTNLKSNHKAIIKIIRELGHVNNTRVVIGSADEINSHRSNEGLSSIGSTGNKVHGVFDPSNNTIYISDLTGETLTHELIHAATFSTLQNYYDGTGKVPTTARASIKRLEKLMEHTLSQDTNTDRIVSNVAFSNMRDAIEKHSAEGRHAEALNEFMAWGLANQELNRTLKKLPIIKKIANTVAKATRELIIRLFGAKFDPNASVLRSLLFETTVIAQAQSEATNNTVNSENVLEHATAIEESDTARVMNIRQSVVAGIASVANTLPHKDMNPKIVDAMERNTSSMNEVAAWFDMNTLEQGTFRLIGTALMVGAKVNPAAVTKLQDLHASFIDTVKLEDLQDPNIRDEYVRDQYALRRFNILTGTGDTFGGDMALPVFFGLALTSREFRDMLSKITPTKQMKKTDSNWDSFLTDGANSLLDTLENTLAGVDPSGTILSQVDALQKVWGNSLTKESGVIENVLEATSELKNNANSFVAKGIDKLASKLQEVPNKKAQLLGQLLDNSKTDEVITQVEDMFNQKDISDTTRRLMVDIVGMTESNEAVYALIKPVRALVQKSRQLYRTKIPKQIADSFSRSVTHSEWNSLHIGLGKTDIGSLVNINQSPKEVIKLLTDSKALTNKIKETEANITEPRYISKAKQLATYMMTGVPGINLLTNATQIANLYGETNRPTKVNEEDINAINELTSLYALQQLDTKTKDDISTLNVTDSKALWELINILKAQNQSINKKYDSDVIKGYIPNDIKQGQSLRVIDDSEYVGLIERGFKRIGDYVPSKLDPDKSKKGYYYSPMDAKAPFSQGVVQNIVSDLGGINRKSNTLADTPIAAITDEAILERYKKNMYKDTGTTTLIPRYNHEGELIALDRGVDPVMMATVKRNDNLAMNIGSWLGRAREIQLAGDMNNLVAKQVHRMYKEQIAKDPNAKRQYINIFDPELKDPVIKDAVSVMSSDVKQDLRIYFGGDEVFIRRDMLEDVIGARNPSITDFWTGNTRWSPETAKTVREAITTIFGREAYLRLAQAEKLIQGLVNYTTNTIVVKSVIVPTVNIISNIGQLVSIGVPMQDIAKGIGKFLSQTNSHVKYENRLVELEVRKAATNESGVLRGINAQISNIKEAQKRLDIHPLIIAGEFSTIADLGIGTDDIDLTSGNVDNWFNQAINRLPPEAQTLARNLVISKDTALYKGLEKSVLYGDFIAKAILFDYMRKQGSSEEQAITRIIDEFVNYDLSMGRNRKALESMGLLWFYNYKLRSIKAAQRILRNSPVTALLGGSFADSTMQGVGTPVHDNLLTKAMEGSLGYSIGPGMGTRGATAHPVAEMLF